MKKLKSIGVSMTLVFILSIIPIVESNVSIDNVPPEVKMVNPKEGYFHFSGIKIFPTILNIKSDTMGFGGFRIRPVQVQVEDNVDSEEEIIIYMYVKEDEKGEYDLE